MNKLEIWRKQMSNSQKGFSSLLVIIALVAVVGVFILYILNVVANTEVPLLPENSDSVVTGNSETTFEELEEDETTPIEIDNVTVTELDTLIMDVENDSDIDESLEF